MSYPQVSPLEYFEEEEGLNEECKTLLSSLPKERGWASTQLYQYHAFWYTARTLQGVLSCQQHFLATLVDLFLITSPKSGTTWLKALAFTIINLSKYSTFHHPLLTPNPHELVPYLEVNLFMNNQIPDLTSFSSPRLFCSHIPYASLPNSIPQLGCKLVYLCRNPRDTFISLWHFTNRLRPKTLGTLSLDEEFERFCKGVCVNGPFWDHVLGYWKESLERPDTVLFLKFEELKVQPNVQLRRIAKFLGYPFSEEKEGVVEEILRLCSFDHLSNLDVNKNGKTVFGVEHNAFFRRGEVGYWDNHLIPEMIQQFELFVEYKFYRSGLTF
ncbi:cytosolic sulfotransferase 15-like [Macadamia integrifolia]|uniref:cytosolic sulfotransferase 15-like n=1 Tax=Macadamia integrifolia TaxID=60698 RepID=UPI001C4EC494|nr:cytosolic sulfotransferase 15-like [Macadamia integrifolia]